MVEHGGEEKHLEIGLSIANDRLFVKATSTNILLHEIRNADLTPIEGNVPQIAYLPPFAGITVREGRLTPAMRGRMIGQGLSGSVIRNALFDLYEANRIKRAKLRGIRSKIKDSELAELRRSDPWEILTKTLQEIFATDLRIAHFDERYHSYLDVKSVRGSIENRVFKAYPKFSPRDLMVEGSGFLQWLSVYTLALSPEIDIVLLDEPDAHLHTQLQQELTSKLGQIATEKSRQVLLATHSPDLIRSYAYDQVLQISGKKAKYLSASVDKVGVLAGVGSPYTPTLHALMEHKRLLILEADSDERFLRILAERAGVSWPKNLVPWYWTGGVKERKQLFLQLRREIPDITSISIRDRDDEQDGTVDADLIDKLHKPVASFSALKWRRRHIENYLLVPAAIARASGKTEATVREFIADKHALALPASISATDVLMPIRDARGKEILTEGSDSISKEFGISRDEIAGQLASDEIAEDLNTFFQAITKLCSV